MNTPNIPGFTAEATLSRSGRYYQIATFPSSSHLVVPQSRATCAFKAGRLAGRCLAAGYDHYDCMELAADFNNFCNAYDL
jgi:hypothetical protein